MSYLSWRDRARPVIAAVLRENGGADERTLRRALHDAYPFGERAMHPYKVWLDEIARQRGRKRDPRAKKEQVALADAGQRDLFEADRP